LLGHLYNAGPTRKFSRHRKLRLFKCACCRRIWHLLTDEQSRHAVEAAELLADGLLSNEEVQTARHGAAAAIGSSGPWINLSANAARAAIESWSPHFCAALASSAIEMQHRYTPGDLQDAERQAQLLLLRCLFGNPFRAIPLDPIWRSRDACDLAALIYKECAFDRLPILGDALEEAGCSDQDMLDHCRSAGPHGRGCWVVDAILPRLAGASKEDVK
jgi:hypothetical protein